MNIKEMLARQQAIVDAAKAAGRGLNTDEQREFDELQGKITAARQAAENSAAGNGGTDGSNGAEGADNQRTAEDAAQRAVAAERQRMSDISSLCRQTGMDPQEYIQNGNSLDDVRAAAVTFLVNNNGPIGARSGGDEADNFRGAAVDAMLMRAGVSVAQPTQGAEDLRGMTLRDMAIECMAREGLGSTQSLLRMSRDDLWTMACRQFYNPTAAFPAILDNAIKKAIVHQYQHVPTTFELWTSKGNVTDFKPTKDHNYLMGGAGEFLPVGENGELKHDTPQTDLLPQRQIKTYGRQFSMTREAFINDDVGFITEVPGAYAASAKRTINKQVYTILVQNPAIFDGVRLFDAAHSNHITTGSKPSNEAIQKLMSKMLLQKDPFGESIMVQPAHIIVPVGYAFLMSTILESPTINTTENTQAVNPLFKYRNQLSIIEEGTINALAGTAAAPWFMVGNKAYARSLQVDYLNGQETPTIRRMEQAGQLGFTWDIFLDWGITAVDFRGISRNDGVIITD